MWKLGVHFSLTSGSWEDTNSCCSLTWLQNDEERKYKTNDIYLWLSVSRRKPWMHTYLWLQDDEEANKWQFISDSLPVSRHKLRMYTLPLTSGCGGGINWGGYFLASSPSSRSTRCLWNMELGSSFFFFFFSFFCSSFSAHNPATSTAAPVDLSFYTRPEITPPT